VDQLLFLAPVANWDFGMVRAEVGVTKTLPPPFTSILLFVEENFLGSGDGRRDSADRI